MFFLFLQRNLEEEQEESRPPMDLFKAIFAISSDDESSSSSEGESDDEEEVKDVKEEQMDPQPQNLFSITSSETCAQVKGQRFSWSELCRE